MQIIGDKRRKATSKRCLCLTCTAKVSPVVAVTRAASVGVASVASVASAALSMAFLVLLSSWDMTLHPTTASAAAAASVTTAVALVATARVVATAIA